MRAPTTTYTPTEREILQLLADGHTSRSAAKKMWVEPCTVKEHLRRFRARHKLSSTSTAAVVFAMRQGWIE